MFTKLAVSSGQLTTSKVKQQNEGAAQAATASDGFIVCLPLPEGSVTHTRKYGISQGTVGSSSLAFINVSSAHLQQLPQQVAWQMAQDLL